MLVEQTAAPSAVAASCSGGRTLTFLFSTSTIFTTLPTVIRTFYRAVTFTETNSNGIDPITSRVIQTVRLASIPTETKFELVTYTTCIGAAPAVRTTSMTLSSQFSTAMEPTEAAKPPEASPDSQPGADSHKTMLITAAVGGISIVLILATILGFWIWRRARKKNLDLASRNELIEAASSSHSPGRGMHRKISISTTINGTASNNPTLVDYVGLLPSVSQRNLAGPATDVRSAVDTDWSNVRRSSISPPLERVHGIHSQYLRPTRASTRPSHSQHPYTAHYNSSYSRDVSGFVSQIPTAESYTSRGTSAFLRPTGQDRGISYYQSKEHILLPTVYSPDSVRSAAPTEEGDDGRSPPQSAPDDHFPRSPSREWAWAEALRRLESIHERHPIDFTRDPTGDSQFTATQDEFGRDNNEASVMSEEGDYETIMYESEGESRALSMRGPWGDNTDGSIFSVNAVVRRIASEPPRERGRR